MKEEIRALGACICDPVLERDEGVVAAAQMNGVAPAGLELARQIEGGRQHDVLLEGAGAADAAGIDAAMPCIDHDDMPLGHGRPGFQRPSGLHRRQTGTGRRPAQAFQESPPIHPVPRHSILVPRSASGTSSGGAPRFAPLSVKHEVQSISIW